MAEIKMADIKKNKDQASSEAKTKAPGVDARAVLAEMVKQREAEDRVVERRKLGPAHLAKIARQRLALAKDRGGGAALNHAIAMNAADLGMKVEDYRRLFEED